MRRREGYLFGKGTSFAQLVVRHRPVAFVFENVEGFLTAEGGGRVFDLLEPVIRGRPDQRRQLSSLSPLTRRNSSVLSVTSTSSSDSAWAAMSMSLGPIGLPARSRRTRSRP